MLYNILLQYTMLYSIGFGCRDKLRLWESSRWLVLRAAWQRWKRSAVAHPGGAWRSIDTSGSACWVLKEGFKLSLGTV